MESARIVAHLRWAARQHQAAFGRQYPVKPAGQSRVTAAVSMKEVSNEENVQGDLHALGQKGHRAKKDDSTGEAYF